MGLTYAWYWWQISCNKERPDSCVGKFDGKNDDTELIYAQLVDKIVELTAFFLSLSSRCFNSPTKPWNISPWCFTSLTRATACLSSSSSVLDLSFVVIWSALVVRGEVRNTSRSPPSEDLPLSHLSVAV